MSDLSPHSRTDLVELPCDCEPTFDPALFDPHLRAACPECGHGMICSPALCSRNRPRRKLHVALLDEGIRRQLNLRQTVALVTPELPDNIVRLSDVRRAGGRRTV